MSRLLLLPPPRLYSPSLILVLARVVSGTIRFCRLTKYKPEPRPHVPLPAQRVSRRLDGLRPATKTTFVTGPVVPDKKQNNSVDNSALGIAELVWDSLISGQCSTGFFIK